MTRTKTLHLLLARARALWGSDISPCSGKTWEQCVTSYAGFHTLWFNTPDNSTHLCVLRIEEAA